MPEMSDLCYLGKTQLNEVNLEQNIAVQKRKKTWTVKTYRTMSKQIHQLREETECL